MIECDECPNEASKVKWVCGKQLCYDCLAAHLRGECGECVAEKKQNAFFEAVDFFYDLVKEG